MAMELTYKDTAQNLLILRRAEYVRRIPQAG